LITPEKTEILVQKNTAADFDLTTGPPGVFQPHQYLSSMEAYVEDQVSKHVETVSRWRC
jgi:hypothetical protein